MLHVLHSYADSFLAGKDIPFFMGQVYKDPQLQSTQSKMKSLHPTTLHFCKIRFNIITDLINAFPGNGSVNTVQHATIEQRGYATRF
jgi:hypothetical protein